MIRPELVDQVPRRRKRWPRKSYKSLSWEGYISDTLSSGRGDRILIMGQASSILVRHAQPGERKRLVGVSHAVARASPNATKPL